jgi:flavin reductase ActVB
VTTQITLSGDHAIVVGTVEAADINDGEPLLYFAGQYGTYKAL